MCIAKLASTIVISGAIGLFGPTATALADPGTLIGRVVHGGDGSAFRVCFKHDVEVRSGEALAVIRHTSRSTSPKGSLMLESARVGVLRITASGDDHCASAVLVSGSAKWLDWVSIEAGS